jgi:uncharacterized lipoprotein
MTTQFVKIKHIIFTFLVVNILGCSHSLPSHLIVEPNVMVSPSNQLAYKEAQLSVIDMRTSPHIVQILEKNKAAVILSSLERIEDISQRVLTSQWQKQDLSFNSLAQNNMTVIIEKAIVSVEQKNMKYSAQTEIIINVKIDNGKQILTTTFKNRGYNEGSLDADISVLEYNFNQQLSTVLKEVLTSNDINTFL